MAVVYLVKMPLYIDCSDNVICSFECPIQGIFNKATVAQVAFSTLQDLRGIVVTNCLVFSQLNMLHKCRSMATYL